MVISDLDVPLVRRESDAEGWGSHSGFGYLPACPRARGVAGRVLEKRFRT